MRENKYVKFVSDNHVLSCIKELHQAYVKANKDINKKKLYQNKVDTFKMLFDSRFNATDDKQLVKFEIMRQIDKSVNNAIGTFHEQILGGVEGYERGALTGYDVKSNDDTLFADIKNKHNTMNSSSAEGVYRRLARLADDHPSAKCYCVHILAKKSYRKQWKARINKREYNHTRVFLISGDQFYELLTGRRAALHELYQALPTAISDYLKDSPIIEEDASSTALQELLTASRLSNRSILDLITYENYNYYLGYEDEWKRFKKPTKE